MSIKSNDYSLVISASDLVIWVGNEDKHCKANPYLVSALNLLDIYIDPVDLYNQFFENRNAGTGDVYLFSNGGKENSYFAIDMYRGLTDQLDIIEIVFRAKENQEKVKITLRSFFDTVTYQVNFEESHISSRINEIINIDSYPKKMEESGYMKKIYVR